MTMRPITALFALILIPSLAQATFHLNVGSTSGTTGAIAGEGPTGADASYLAYATAHEDAASGALQTFNAVSFAEGGLAGTYNVGVEFSWPDATTDATKQAYGRSNDQGYDVFWRSWVGIDSRSANGGIDGGDRLTLSLTGLEANTDFVLTSYHFDTQNQAGSFTVDQTPTASETATSPFDFPRSDNVDPVGVPAQTPWVDNAYSFDVTSDGSGNLDITYSQNSGTRIGINGFDLVAVPEPSTAVLIGLGMLGLLARRRS